MIDFIDDHKHEFGVEPICAELPIAPSTYYAARGRGPSARDVTDQERLVEIRRVHAASGQVYGARKVHAQLVREGQTIARCTVERLMRHDGLRGVLRVQHPRTTRPAAETDQPADLVDRMFTATRPDQLWVADITNIRTFAGFVYAAFVLDVFSRWLSQPADEVARCVETLPHPHTKPAPTALETPRDPAHLTRVSTDVDRSAPDMAQPATHPSDARARHGSTGG